MMKNLQQRMIVFGVFCLALTCIEVVSMERTEQSIEVRLVQDEQELEWVNSEYKKVDFSPSAWEKDHVAIAILANEKAGIGRLVPLEDGSCELGGMYVLPGFRKQGVAREIVLFLLNSSSTKKIYCLLLARLESLYSSCGFRTINENQTVPKEILDKYTQFLTTCPRAVLIMELERK